LISFLLFVYRKT